AAKIRTTWSTERKPWLGIAGWFQESFHVVKRLSGGALWRGLWPNADQHSRATRDERRNAGAPRARRVGSAAGGARQGRGRYHPAGPRAQRDVHESVGPAPVARLRRPGRPPAALRGVGQ